MNYLDIANNKVMFLFCAVTVAVVFSQSLLFLLKAKRRGVELGITKEVMNKAMLNSAIFSVLPSLPIIVMLLALSVSLGQYFPWLRLSVVGSAVYEGMAAKIAANEAGLDDFTSPGITPEIYVLMMWVMSVGIIWGIVFNIFFMKKLDKFSKEAKSKKNNFIPIFSGALFCGLLSTLSMPYVANVKKVISIVSFVTAGIVVLICNHLANKTKIKAISDFSLPIALIAGMAAAVIYTQLVA